ncbi:hypothetical protein TWF703_009303 [Orbilia oligospora]|uniref:Uncharacterized protein n=1 Tax=Orbilia oligospora TaxID=2813651 RepID=A0A7C8NRT0_ORBOL|nr:hypothetical protein TWF703_009303 [Orbilia oligospora]
MISAAEKDARAVAAILASKLPAELVSEILDYAEYFGHQIIGINEKPGRASTGWVLNYEEMGKEGEGYLDIKLYLIAQIPDFMALHKDTAGRGGLGGGRPGRVRKIVFRLECRDQGWSNHPEVEMTYQWGRSRIDVEIWRKRETGAGGGDDGGEEADEMYKVGESLLQRNKVARADVLEYEVSWRWDQDKPEDDTEDVDLVGRHEKNGQFVRELRGGDEIRIFMKAFYSGWECRIERQNPGDIRSDMRNGTKVHFRLVGW